MKLFIITSLLFIVTMTHLPNLSFGIKCWTCSKIPGVTPGQCSEPLSLREKNCHKNINMCLHMEYLKNNGLRYIDCDIYQSFSFKEKIQCLAEANPINGQSDNVYNRECTCGTDLCNNPNKERIQCYSCYGNRKGINGDEPVDGSSNTKTAVTDFVCKAGEVPVAITCPLNAPVCMIKWNFDQAIIGCNNHQIPEGQTLDGYYVKSQYDYGEGEGEAYCNTNRCNIDSLKDQLPIRRTRKTTTENSANTGKEESSGNENIEEEEPSGSGITEEDKSSPSSMDSSQILIIVIVVLLVVIVTLSTLVVILVFKKKNNQ